MTTSNDGLPPDSAIEVAMNSLGYESDRITDVIADLQREREHRLKSDTEQPVTATGKHGVAVFARPIPPAKIPVPIPADKITIEAQKATIESTHKTIEAQKTTIKLLNQELASFVLRLQPISEEATREAARAAARAEAAVATLSRLTRTETR